MSDFLTRIARLTRGETTAVKPRLPEHFAPAPDTGTVTTLDGATHAQGADRQGMTPDHSGRQAEPRQDSIAPGGHEAKTGRLRAGSDNIAVHAVQEEAGNEDKTGPMTAGIPLSPETVETPAERQTLLSTDGADTVLDLATNLEPQASPLEPAVEGDPVSLRENITATQTPASTVHPKLLVQSQPGGREEAGSPELPGLSETAPSARSEPDVHINIGRIEVRASTSAPRPQARTSRPHPQSSLSLQDYLARDQSGGKRS